MDAQRAIRKALSLAAMPSARLSAAVDAMHPATQAVTQAADAVRSWAEREAVIAKLQHLRALEEQSSLAYRRVADLAIGPAGSAVAEELQAHAADEDRHAGIVARRLVAMGGAMDSLPSILKPVALGDLPDAFAYLAAMEIGGIAEWQSLRAMLAEDDPFRFEIEAILQDEQHHADDLAAYLRAGGCAVALATDY